MHERGIRGIQHQGRRAAREHGSFVSHHVNQLQGIVHGMPQADVARGDRQAFHLGMLMRHQDRQCVIDARVGINQ
jgi:hypothetical protein